MTSFLLWLINNPAHATSYNVRFCMEWDVDFADSTGTVYDDYFNTNTPESALGAYYEVKTAGGVPIAVGYAAESGTYAGCTSVISLSSVIAYDVKVFSKTNIGGNTIVVYDEDTSPALFSEVIWNDWSPTGSGTQTRDTVTVGGWVNLIGAPSFALRQNGGGMTGKSYVIYADGEDDDDDAPGVPCTAETDPTKDGGTENDCGDIWIGAGAQDNRYTIVHEFGHRITRFANGDHTADSNYDLTQETFCDYAGGHAMVTIEYQSAAVNESMAHLFAALAFNDDAGGDCWFRYYKNVDWDNDNSDDSIYWTDCAGNDHCDSVGDSCGPIAAENHLENECPLSSYANRGIEYDWLRFWWDLVAEEGITYDQILDIWAGADPDGWNPDDDGPSILDPAYRLRSSANAQSILTEWDSWDGYDGVDN